MPKWEYCVIDLNEFSETTKEADVLNDAGKEGWELVSITTAKIYLKRRCDEQPRRRRPKTADANTDE